RIKRAASSAAAAETLSVSSAVAESHWLLIMWRDLLFNDVSKPDWHLSQAPFSLVLPRDCSLSEGVSSVSVVDAKSVFDVLTRNSAGTKADERNAIEMAVIR
ncbi:unnamed protein product, partial [Prorocentrum cordatum]